MAGIIFTWPMTLDFFSSIPYTLRPISGFERVPLMPGDQLQSYYWYWLFSDNLFGNSSLLTNPYEFNGPAGPMSTVYANFPFSILYVLLLPLGSIGAYNGLILLSFLLCGLAMFLLARTWTKDLWASLMAGLIFAVFPYRVSHIAGGQLTGYVIFFLPLCLYFIEQTLTTGRKVYGGAAGLCFILMSWMDPHTSFLTTLTVGAYLPSRILLIQPFPLVQGQGWKRISFWTGFFGALTGGLSISFMFWIRFGNKTGLPFWHLDLLQPLILGVISTLLIWLYLSALFSRLTTLSFAEARLQMGKLFFIFLLLWLYALKSRINVPHLGLIVMLLCLGLFSFLLIAQWLKQRDRLLMFDRRRIWTVIIGVGSGFLIASAYLLYVRTTVFLPSVASKGRTIAEIRMFSPKASNFLFWQDINSERFVLLGWGLVILAVFGLIPLFRRNPKKPGHLVLAGVLAFLAAILTLGPTLNAFPLYQFLYQYFPFFKYSRVPGRFLMIGMIFLCLLAGMAVTTIREGLASRGWMRLRKWLPLMIILLVLAEYHTWQPLGISIMSMDNRIYKQIEKSLSDGKRVLELPIWPGDSHQSSAYEYTVTRTRKPMINGYAPVVVRDYVRQIFWPLFPMDYGEFKPNQVEKLKKLKVDLITFHDNSMVYPEKISPFPPRLALKRLMASPSLKFIDHDQDIFLFSTLPLRGGRNGVGVKPKTNLDLINDLSSKESIITSPVSTIFYTNYLPQETGRYVMDPLASGYYLLMDEKALLQGKMVPRPGAKGNVALASPGQDHPGYLVLGPNRYLPSGKYRARFRIKAGPADPLQEVGRLEIIQDRDKLLKQKVFLGREVSPFGTWIDVPLEFETSQVGEIRFRIYFSGKVSLHFNLAIIGFADQNTGPGVIEAEELLRQTGTVVPDTLASGKEAVFGKAGFHPPVFLCHGPYRTFKPGLYRAGFFIRLKDLSPIGKEKNVVLLEVATDMGKRIFSKRTVKVQDLKTDGYEPVRLDFNVPFQCEVGYRVKFLGQTDVLVDRIEVLDSGEGQR